MRTILSVLAATLALTIAIPAQANQCDVQFAGNPTESEIADQAQAAQLLNLQSRISNFENLRQKQRAIRNWRVFNGRRERASILARDGIMSQLNQNMGLGVTRESVNLVAEPFEAVEVGVRMITKLDWQLRNRDMTPAMRAELESQKTEHEKLLGKHIETYIHFRRFFDRVKGAESQRREGQPYSQTYRDSAARIFGFLGIEASEQRGQLEALGVNVQRPTLRSVIQTYQDSEVAIAAKLQRDLNSERVTGLQTLFSSIFFAKELRGFGQKTFNWVATRNAFVGRIFASIFAEARDHRARLIDLNQVRRVILLRNATPEQKTTELRALYNANRDGTLLITFARVYEVRNEWNALKAVALAQSEQDGHAKAFYDKMVEAETVGLVYGEISENHPSPPVDRVARWIIFGMTGATWVYQEIGSETWPLWTQVDAFFRMLGLQ